MDNMDTEKKNRSGKSSGRFAYWRGLLASIVLNNLKESCTVKLSAQLSLVYIILLLFFHRSFVSSFGKIREKS
jgi:hypothetical protein